MVARCSAFPADFGLADEIAQVEAEPGAARRPSAFHEQPAAPPTVQSKPYVRDRTVATTVYLAPSDHVRLRYLALKRNVSFQTLVMDALDMLLAQKGEAPVERWETRRKVREDSERP